MTSDRMRTITIGDRTISYDVGFDDTENIGKKEF
jgi:hypothetical protein